MTESNINKKPKYAVLTMDVEEPLVMIDGLTEFLSLLNKHDIKGTLFAVSKSVAENASLQEELKKAAKQGHEVACHGYAHIRPQLIETQQFAKELKQAREELSSLFDCEITGYRAPYFGIDDERYRIVRETGFNYSSSKMDVPMHPLYGNINLEGFEESAVQGVYQNNGFVEFPMCTEKVLGKNISISGGGWLRIMPWRCMMKRLIKKHIQEQQCYVYYTHPYEWSKQRLAENVEKKLLSRAVQTVRMYAGRKRIKSKIETLIMMLKDEGYSFCTFDELRSIAISNNKHIGKSNAEIQV